ncbi:MAG TPA: hypothetical protein VNO26_06995 [Candidatus Limnocylindria bacterium]|nr:hypothetical protein [Candidatus Limnocylindria bacterium]
MMRRASLRHLAFAVALATGFAPAAARAADEVGVAGLKLIIVDKMAATGKAKAVFVAKDPAIGKGSGTDTAAIDANLSFFYTDRPDVRGGFLMPANGKWLVNKETVAKYVNKGAPSDGAVKVSVIKPGTLAKVVGKALGDPGHEIDLVSGGAPTDAGGITAILTVRNHADKSVTRMCTRFSVADGSTVSFKEISGGTGRKLVAKNGVPCEPECDPLNAAECLLPYPSSQYLVPDPTTPSGWRLNLKESGLLTLTGPPLTAREFNQLDGFSPTTQILMHFPQGVDVTLSDAPRLLEPGCCGQPAGPPWIDTRTYDDRSLDADSPSVLIDADTNERIVHFLEVDSRATGGNVPGRQALFLRPGKSLTPGHRYIVAMRNLKTPANDDVTAEAAFAALRDNAPDASVERRRAYFEEQIFSVLTANGIDRSELVLAFDFRVASDIQLTRQLVSMRDQAFAWLAEVDATPATVPFTVTSTQDFDCDVPGTVIWRKVSGTFQSPYFLDAPLSQTGVQYLLTDFDDMPVQNGFMDAPFDISIPCSVHDPMVTSRPMVIGHGLFGTGVGAVQSQIDAKAPWAEWTYIAGGTDWLGLSDNRDASGDLLWLGTHIVGLGSSKLHQFAAFPDRLRQGVLNTLVLARMMKLGIFNRDPAFETSPGNGVFPGPSEEMYYSGSSLGGIYGTLFAGLTPDVERFNLDVPSIAFSCLLQRSTQFVTFDAILPGIGINDPMEYALFLDLLHEIWVSAEPAALATHVTSDPLPGSGPAKKVFMSVAWLDKQVSNQCTEIMARTLNVPNLEGSLQAQLQQIPDVTGPVDSAYVMYSSGAFDLFNVAHQPHIPPLANLFPTDKCDPHGSPRRTPAHVFQFYDFLQPGGQIINYCNGTCDASEPIEIPGGGTCDAGSGPLAGTKCLSDAECGGGLCVGTICDPTL